jgi:ribonuclease HI
MIEELQQVTIYVDGSCLGNPGNGGWGAVLSCDGIEKEFSGFIPDTTNNRAELTAMIEALKLLKWPCEVVIYSDSQITVNCAEGLNARHKNKDLWAEYDAVSGQHFVNVQWVEGHIGHDGNERAHKLAEKAARRK